ncbi:MAG: pseudouridine synthase [Rikenellaceae bacterium]
MAQRDPNLHTLWCEVDSETTTMRLNNPHDYRPHKLVLAAREQIISLIATLSDERKEIARDIEKGKMFGALIVGTPSGEIGFLAGFSGSLSGQTTLPHFVPPIFDLDATNGYFIEEERAISEVNERIRSIEESADYLSTLSDYEASERETRRLIEAAKAEYRRSKEGRDALRRSGECSAEELAQINRESQHQKGEIRRKELALKERLAEKQIKLEAITAQIESLKQQRITMSNELQRKLFESYRVVNGRGEWRSLASIFEERFNRLPPAGAGECAAPKLLHYALTHSYTPLSIGEFWVGRSPRGEVRHDGEFYGACRGKCEPILGFVLQGVDMEERCDATSTKRYQLSDLEILFEDQAIVAINKPSGLLSVDGPGEAQSLESIVKGKFGPEAMMVHRLDQDTSGVILVAKSGETYNALQQQFIKREVSKCYKAIVEGIVESQSGEIELPMRPNPLDRPRQIVDFERGKEARTTYRVEGYTSDGWSRLTLYPHSGRTHQLRLHCGHSEGLSTPIVGDRLYGSGSDSASRLLLHAESIHFAHPTSGEEMTIRCEVPF